MAAGAGAARRGVVRGAAGVAALAAFVLGWIGFALFLPAPGVDAGERWTDLLYYTLQLFLLDAAPLQSATDLPVVLEIARFLAPASAVAGVATAAKAVYDSTYHAVRTRALRDHTVICGSGPSAMLLAGEVLAEGRSCAVVGDGVVVSSPRVVPVVGDPRDPLVLREARVAQAHEVLVVTGDSMGTVDVATALRGELDGADVAVPCYLEMRSGELAVVLAAHELNSGSSRIEFFDPVDRAVRRLLDVHLTAGAGSVVVLGAGGLATALGDELERRRHTWSAVASPDLPSWRPPADLVLVVVAVDGDEAAVALGLRVLGQVSGHAVDVVVATRTSASLARRATPGSTPTTRAGRASLRLFSTTEQVYRLAVLRDGLFGRLARSVHQAYVEQARARGETEHTNPSTVSWERLPEDLRRENLAQAEAFAGYLRSLPAVVVPGDPGVPFAFQGAEVERLAQEEHDRWCASKRARGWTYAERRDDDARHHPDLVAWDDLDAGAREKDRDAVRAVPDHLRRIGLRVVRVA